MIGPVKCHEDNLGTMSSCFTFRVKGRCGGHEALVGDADAVINMAMDMSVDMVTG